MGTVLSIFSQVLRLQLASEKPRSMGCCVVRVHFKAMNGADFREPGLNYLNLIIRHGFSIWPFLLNSGCPVAFPSWQLATKSAGENRQ
jgi:hypothetical protein